MSLVPDLAVPSTDIHTHLAPDSAAVAHLPGIEQRADGCLRVDGDWVAHPGLYDAIRLVERMAGTGIECSWVSVPPPFYRQGLPTKECAHWVSAVNDGLLSRIAGHRGLAALAYLPLDRPSVALAEIARLDATVAGYSAAAGGGSLPLDHDALAPVWAAVAAADRPLVLHPGSTPDARLSRFYLENLLGNPTETTVAAAELVFGGVLARHDRLRVALVHCGGAVAALVGRWQRGVATARPGVPRLALPPAEAVRRLWIDALAHDARVVALACAVFGADRLVLGSDYPFPMGVEDPWESVCGLSAADRESAARANAAELLSGPVA